MKNKQDNPIDDLFRAQFEGFENAVPRKSWEQISEQLTEQSFDDVIKDKITNLEKEPSPAVWVKVKRELPYSLVLRNHLNSLSKIAAILVLGMLCYAIINKNHTKENLAAAPIIETSPTEVATPIEAPTAEAPSYVFEIESKKAKVKTSVSKAMAADDEDLESLLADLLDNDDDLMESINKKRIEKALSPLHNLPIEGIVDNFSFEKDSNDYYADDYQYAEEEDLKIWVPIRYIEDYEIEAMLNNYDKSVGDR